MRETPRRIKKLYKPSTIERPSLSLACWHGSVAELGFNHKLVGACSAELVREKCFGAVETKVCDLLVHCASFWKLIVCIASFLQLSAVANYLCPEGRCQRCRRHSHRFAACDCISQNGTRPHHICALQRHMQKTDRFYLLILATGILPAGLMLRVFILNTLIRFRFISVDSIVSNSDAPARSLKLLC